MEEVALIRIPILVKSINNKYLLLMNAPMFKLRFIFISIFYVIVVFTSIGKIKTSFKDFNKT